MNVDKKLIYFLVALNIFLAIILLVKIKTTPKYNPIIYDEINDEYEEIFGEENNWSDTQNMQRDNSVKEETNNQTTVVGTAIPNNIEQGNVIGKIIIPKIGIKYPIIKETTTEYLKVAPTKYCGPEVNEMREFGHSGA